MTDDADYFPACRYCRGTRRIAYEPGSSLTYRCPDCDPIYEDTEVEDKETETND